MDSVSDHVLSIRVYYEDTDAGGIVYHANYLKFCERARTEALRATGFELSNLLFLHNVQFVVHSAELQFLRSAQLDQLLYIVTKVTEVRAASILYNHRIYLEAVDGPLLCQADIRLAAVDSQRRLCKLPKIVVKGIKK